MRGWSAQNKIPGGAGSRQGLRACGLLWLLRLLVLAGIWIYPPAEAFDGDADVGFDEVLVEAIHSRCGLESITPQHPSAPNPPAWRDVTSLRPGATPLVGKPDGPAIRQARLLRASRLCACSRLRDGPVSWQGQVTSARWILTDALLTASTDV